MADFSSDLLVLTACKGSITAKKIAREVVAQKLAASARILSDINSFFHWVGKVENSEEQMILIWTNHASYKELEKSIKRLHPHELPEITAVPINTLATDNLSG